MKITYCYSLEKKKIYIEVQKIALEKKNTIAIIGFTREKTSTLKI